MSIKLYIEVSKPRIVVVLVITAVTSALAATRFDASPDVGWDVLASDLLFLAVAGAMASMGASALNHYYDRDIDRIMDRTSQRPIPAHKICCEKSFRLRTWDVCVVSCNGLVFAQPICLGNDFHWHNILRSSFTLFGLNVIIP